VLGLFDTLDEIKKYTIDYYDKVIRMIGEIRKRKDKKLVEVVKDYVLKHYNEDITLNRIAEIVYMNPSYICDLFKNQTGEHFVVFLTRVRIDKAKALLKNVKIKTYEVGQMVGYEDPTYFSKVFKKVVGVSPSEYRSLVD
jgi:two-component system response regulator YesN